MRRLGLGRIGLGRSMLGPVVGGMAPSILADFVSQRYTPLRFGAGLSLTRASAASYTDAAGVMQMAPADQPRFDYDPVTLAPSGLLIEAAGTNIYLQSGAPITRTVAVTAQAYALSFWGSGSITLSGAHTATLTGSGTAVRATLVFTPAAGNLTLTVAGDVQLVQLEAGTRATSYIPTTSGPATRSPDALAPISLSGLWAAAGGIGGTILMDVDVGGPVNTTRGYLWQINDVGLNRLALRGWNQGVTDDSCKIVVGDGTANTDTLIATALRGRQRIAASYINGAAPMVSISGAAVVTSARNYVHDPANTTITFGGGFYGHLRSIRIYRGPMTGPQLQSLTA